MRKNVILFSGSTLLLIAGIFLFRLKNWPYSSCLIYCAIIYLIFFTTISLVLLWKQRAKVILSGILFLVILVLGTGSLFRLMNWSDTFFWPVHTYYMSLESVEADYKSYGWPKSNEDPPLFLNKIPLEQLHQKKYLKSFLVVYNDTLVFEKYYNGTEQNSACNIASCTKSIVSASLGVAIDKKLIESEEIRLKDCMSEYYSLSTEALKEDITLKHLLTMQAGWSSGKGNALNLSGFNWIKSSMENPLSFVPGAEFAYNNIEPHIILQLIEKLSGQNGYDFINQNLFKPLDIHIAHWAQTPDDKYFGAGGMYMTARDMARFGQLYLKGGELEGKRIVSREWIVKSTRNYSPENLKIIGNAAAGYGYYWWIDDYQGFEVWQANGAAGQLIFVVPSLDLIVVTTSMINVSRKDAGANSLELIELINAFIFDCKNN